MQGKTLYPTNCLPLKRSLSELKEDFRPPALQITNENCVNATLSHSACIFFRGILLTSKSAFSLVSILLWPKFVFSLWVHLLWVHKARALFSAFHHMFLCLWSREHSCNYPHVVVDMTKVQRLNDQLVITSLGFRTAAKIQTLRGLFHIPTCSIWLVGGQNQGEASGSPWFSCWFLYSLADLGHVTYPMMVHFPHL